MPIIENFTVQAGDDIELQFDVDPDTNIDLTGATIRWWVARSEFTKPDRVTLVKSTGAGISVVSTSEGKFTVTLARADTLGLIGDYYHEAKVTDAQGNWVTVTKGTMTVERTLIRAAGET